MIRRVISAVSNTLRQGRENEQTKVTPETTKRAIRERLEAQKARILALDSQTDVHRGTT